MSALESEVTESTVFDAVIDDIRRWSSISEDECQHFVSTEDGVLDDVELMCQLRILFPFDFVVFNQTPCVDQVS